MVTSHQQSVSARPRLSRRQQKITKTMASPGVKSAVGLENGTAGQKMRAKSCRSPCACDTRNNDTWRLWLRVVEGTTLPDYLITIKHKGLKQRAQKALLRKIHFLSSPLLVKSQRNDNECIENSIRKVKHLRWNTWVQDTWEVMPMHLWDHSANSLSSFASRKYACCPCLRLPYLCYHTNMSHRPPKLLVSFNLVKCF